MKVTGCRIALELIENVPEDGIVITKNIGEVYHNVDDKPYCILQRCDEEEMLNLMIDRSLPLGKKIESYSQCSPFIIEYALQTCET